MSGEPSEPSVRWNPLDSLYALTLPRYMTDTSAWHGHIPWAFSLVEMIKPRSIVELGVQLGDSYFSWCQAVGVLSLRHGFECSVVGIDNFLGDKHTGSYETEAVYKAVTDHNTKHYNDFSTIIRSDFDGALADIPDSSIDILHIDGCHDYTAVHHDFETWREKISPTGAILLHDIEIFDSPTTGQLVDGPSILWNQIKPLFPGHWFEFPHSFGLGTLFPREMPPEVVSMFYASASDKLLTQRYFAKLAQRINAFVVQSEAS